MEKDFQVLRVLFFDRLASGERDVKISELPFKRLELCLITFDIFDVGVK